MAYSTTLTNFAQSVYLAVKNRYFDDITSTDGQTYISQVVDWINQYLDELENVTDAFGRPVIFNFMRTNNYNLGTAVLGASTLTLPAAVLRLVASPKRPVYIVVGGKTISTWNVVNANQIDTNSTTKQVAQTGGTLIFNQALTSQEAGGTIYGDVATSLTRVATDGTDDSVLAVVKPKQLLVLGVAKNSSLPDIIKGGLSPSFVQKYNDLLTQAILLNSSTASADVTDREDWGFVTGVGF